MFSLGGFPGVYHTGIMRDIIKGELFEVDDETLTKLNRLEGYQEGVEPTFYDRMSLPLNEYCNLKSVDSAYIYTYVDVTRLVQLPPIANGDWVSYKGER